ncbi:DMT family transporter [Jannaschia sp. W003]|uniref:DMT family transporter n=1 Tax=Jannaschia sp. W003 TaxID=2867012 RepID=UPI0021A50A9A|nr:DMT family transporter [Jannaschia sp. W003]UWQ21154.1 DMT family transporter [Jannaschia sp. W003]
MPLWVAATLFAATVQALRFFLQRRLSLRGAGPAAATFARFLYAPLALGAGLAVFHARGGALPATGAGFWPYAAAGGVAQILATMCVVALFSRRNFAVGMAFSKTTVLMTLAVGFALLGELPSAPAIAAMAVGVGGVVLLSVPAGVAWREAARSPAVLYGLGSGAFFAVSGVSYRGASLAVEAAEPLLRAAVTLFFVTLLQTALLAVWLLWRDREGLLRVLRDWRITLAIGATSMLGSLGWFTAYTLEQAALVNAVGQVELLLSLGISWIALGERSTPRELAGVALVGGSVAALLLI